MLAAAVCSALAVDNRNFHAWNYRQFLVKLMDLPTEGELNYSTSLIAGGTAKVILQWGGDEGLRVQTTAETSQPRAELQSCARPPNMLIHKHAGYLLGLATPCGSM